jgi:hypothetical protein
MYYFWAYFVALWTTLIVPCVTNPVNWKYCFNDWDVWLYPEIQRAWDLYQRNEKPYQEEREILDSINNTE